MITFGPLVDAPTDLRRGGFSIRLFGRTLYRSSGLKVRVLLEDLLVYQDGYLICVVQAGFHSDGMSVPWFARWKWNDNWSAKYKAPAYFHDDLIDNSVKSKRELDWLFMGALLGQGVSSLECVLFYLAVRTKRGRK